MIGALFSSKASHSEKPVAVSMGEPAGIGPECALKAWAARKQHGLQPFFIIGDPAALAAEAKLAGLNVPIHEIDKPSQALGRFAKGLPVLPLALHVAPKPGLPDPANAPAVIESIRQGANFAQSGEASALVTLPIHKSVLYHSGFNFPGHTEFLGELCGSPETVMMLEVSGLRVTLTTVHVSLKEAVSLITTDRIVSRALITARALQDFGFEKPRIAIAGLNPHAGEEGAMGLEEIEIIQPAIDQLRAKGVNATGPHSADTLFHAGMRAKYDCAHCHYHDQGLIPIKTLDFYGGVNITLGLPIIRTSPDHGTALNIAGQNKANATSVIAALKRAAQLAN